MVKMKKYKKIIIQCILIFIALFFVLRFAKEKYFDEAMNYYTTKVIGQSGSEKIQLKEESGEVKREFVVTTDVLWGLGLSFERHQEKPQGEIKMTVTDEQGEQLYQAITPIRDIQNNKVYWLPFEKIVEDSKGKVITLVLQVKDIAKGDTLEIFVDNKGDIKIGQIYAQNAYLVKMFWAFAVLMLLFVYGIYFGLYIKKWKIEVIFLIVIIFVGMMYAFLVKPGAVPDESGHYRTAYAYSNVLLGKSDGSRAEVWMDDADYEFYQTTWYPEPTTSAYRDFQTDFLRRTSRTQMINTTRKPINAPAYLYIGSVIGMTIGRVIGFNGLTVFYLGRFFNVLVFAALAFWAMKKLPFYKMSLFALCLFPMTTHLIGSFSYDGMILAISLVLVAHIIQLAFGDKEGKNLKELIIIAIMSVLLGGCKGGAYVPLLGLLFLVPTRCFKDKKTKIIFGGGVALCTVAMFVLTAATAIGSSIGPADAQAQSTTYYVGWIFENPIAFIQLLSNTVATKSGGIIHSLIGAELGWFNIPISTTLVFCFFGIFAISCVYVREKQAGLLLFQRQKIGIGIVLTLSVAMVAAGMMFSWTLLGEPAIEGIQGRYFLPLLLPLVLCLKNTNLTLQKSLDRKMIFALVWLHIFVFISVLGVTFTTLL